MYKNVLFILSQANLKVFLLGADLTLRFHLAKLQQFLSRRAIYLVCHMAQSKTQTRKLKSYQQIEKIFKNPATAFTGVIKTHNFHIQKSTQWPFDNTIQGDQTDFNHG